jgi:predicted transcriptional regulator
VQKRSSVTISINILEAASKPNNKMRLMHATNLNYIRFNEYLFQFLQKGFIETINDVDGNLCYCISLKGKAVLAVLKKANELGFF